MGKRVLVVDDGFGDRMIMRSHLVSLGYQVVGEARNIQESLEKYDKLRPDLVLMDGIIPDVDGVSAIMKIIRLDYEANIIICVNRGQRSLAMEAISAGAKDFVMKPVNERALRRVIKRVIG